ncbi:MAG: M48 family metalloprotease [Phycisphaeraceae bacterium]
MHNQFIRRSTHCLLAAAFALGLAACTDQQPAAETPDQDTGDNAAMTMRDGDAPVPPTAADSADRASSNTPDPASRAASEAPEPADPPESNDPPPTLSDNTRKLIAKVISQTQRGSRGIDSLIQGLAGLPDDRLHEYGTMLYEQRLEQGGLITEGPYAQRAEQLAKPVLELGTRDFDYTISVVESDVINAFATAGGYIYLHTALMDALTDQQLTFVIGHEVAHVELQHTDSVFTYADRLGLLAGDDAAWVAAALLSQHIGVGYSEDQEFEADAWGLQKTLPLGVTAKDAIQTFELLAKTSGESLEKPQESETVLDELARQRDQHYKTHPPSRDRIQQIKNLSNP